jgi:hypothetical protein
VRRNDDQRPEHPVTGSLVFLAAWCGALLAMATRIARSAHA